MDVVKLAQAIFFSLHIHCQPLLQIYSKYKKTGKWNSCHQHLHYYIFWPIHFFIVQIKNVWVRKQQECSLYQLCDFSKSILILINKATNDHCPIVCNFSDSLFRPITHFQMLTLSTSAIFKSSASELYAVIYLLLLLPLTICCSLGTSEWLKTVWEKRP